MVTVIAIHLKPTVSDTEPQASSLCAVGCSGSPGECLGVGRVGILADFTGTDSSLHVHWFLSCKRPSQAWQPEGSVKVVLMKGKHPSTRVRPGAINHCRSFLPRRLAQCFKLVLLS